MLVLMVALMVVGLVVAIAPLVGTVVATDRRAPAHSASPVALAQRVSAVGERAA